MTDPSNILSALIMLVGFITVVLKLYEALLGLHTKGSSWQVIISVAFLSIITLIAIASMYNYFTNPEQRLISMIVFMILMTMVFGWHIAILNQNQRVSNELICRLTKTNEILTAENQDIQEELKIANETQTRLFEQKNKIREELGKSMAGFKFEKITIWAPIRDGMAFVKILETGITTSFDLITDTNSQIYQSYSSFRNIQSSQRDIRDCVLTSNRVSETPEEKNARGFATKNKAAIPFLPQHHEFGQHSNTTQFPLLIIQCMNKTNGRGHFEESDKLDFRTLSRRPEQSGKRTGEISQGRPNAFI